MSRTILFSWALVLTTLLTPFTPRSMAAESQAVTLNVPGMTCKFCPITIRKALKKVPGVVEVKSDYKTKTATVTFDPDKLNTTTLTNVTANAGYPSIVKSK